MLKTIAAVLLATSVIAAPALAAEAAKPMGQAPQSTQTDIKAGTTTSASAKANADVKAKGTVTPGTKPAKHVAKKHIKHVKHLKHVRAKSHLKAAKHIKTTSQKGHYLRAAVKPTTQPRAN